MPDYRRFLPSRPISEFMYYQRYGTNVTPLDPIGGTISSDGTYKYHTFDTIGTSTFSLRFDKTVEVFCWGAGGAGGTVGGWSYGSFGGAGGFAGGFAALPAGNYTIMVGQKGAVNGLGTTLGGGAAGYAGGTDNRYGSQGGGLSGIFTSYNASGAIIIAGGGGGGGSSRAGTGNQGGAGGGTTGQDGGSPYDGKASYAGRGGGQSGPTALPTNGNSVAATQFNGGVSVNYGGGGGGGWWGGSGGAYSESNTMSGGGGGSGYINTLYVSNGTNLQGNYTVPANSEHPLRNGRGNGGAVASVGTDGLVVIRYPL